MNARLPSTVTSAEERAARAAKDVAGDPFGQEIADQRPVALADPARPLLGGDADVVEDVEERGRIDGVAGEELALVAGDLAAEQGHPGDALDAGHGRDRPGNRAAISDPRRVGGVVEVDVAGGVGAGLAVARELAHGRAEQDLVVARLGDVAAIKDSPLRMALTIMENVKGVLGSLCASTTSIAL